MTWLGTLLLLMWIALLVLQVVGLAGLRQAGPRRLRIALVLSALAGVVPVLTLLSFSFVFLQGGSNLAQFNDETTIPLWSFWFHVWPIFFFALPLSVAVHLAAVLLDFAPRRRTFSLIARSCGFLAAVLSWLVILVVFPDA